MKKEQVIYQLKITLKGSKPPIWRRVLVSGASSLQDLHYIIQTIMESWDDSHLHAFTIDGEEYGEQRDESDMDYDESEFTLGEIIEQGIKKFSYTYDFGDDWEHQIIVEKELPPEAGKKYPVCIAGKRACPPEDIGGVWGYEEFVKAFQNPKHKNHKNMREWYDHDFNPETFSLEEVNTKLQK